MVHEMVVVGVVWGVEYWLINVPGRVPKIYSIKDSICCVLLPCLGCTKSHSIKIQIHATRVRVVINLSRLANTVSLLVIEEMRAL